MAVRKAKAKSSVKSTQICTTCKEEKPYTAYFKDGSDKNGPRRRKECKECYKKRRKERELAKTLPEVIRMTPIKHID